MAAESSRQAGQSDPVKAFSVYMAQVNSELKMLVADLEQRRVQAGETAQLSEQELDAIVSGMEQRRPGFAGADDVRRTALEKALENTIVNLPEMAASEWQDDDAHLLLYQDVLDIIVTFVNRQLVDGTLAMTAIEILFEGQTVTTIEKLFGYLESRRDRLIEGMVSGKGKALVILRTLNDLLRRLSKSTHTVFCGRILLFLADIFPLGERSGVNLRGEFNKDNVTHFEAVPEEAADEEGQPQRGDSVEVDDDSEMVEAQLLSRSTSTEGKTKQGVQTDKANSVGTQKQDKPSSPIVKEAPEDGEEVEGGMDLDSAVDSAKAAESSLLSPTKAIDRSRSGDEPTFYTLFWSLQRYFSDPLSLFQAGVHPNLPESLAKFASSFPLVPALSKDGAVIETNMAAATPNLTLLREGIKKLLLVFSEASKREKALQGAAKRAGHDTSKAASQQKSVTEQEVRNMFFYPKFLTSKALLDLEIADANFRKQVMIQCLILCQYLQSFTEQAKLKMAASVSGPSNRSVTLPYKLSEADHKWVRDLEAKVYFEISRTPNDGETFVKTVRTVLQNERNWIRWKVNLCPPIEKPPLEQERSAEAQAARKKLDAPAPGFPHKAGTAALSRLWQHEAERPEDAVKLHGTNADVEQMFEEIRKQDGLLEFRKEELRDEGKTDPKDWQNDAELQQIQERKASVAWRTLRLVSGQHLAHFGKVGVMNVGALIDELEKPSKSLSSLPSTGGEAAEESKPKIDQSNAAASSDETDGIGKPASNHVGFGGEGDVSSISLLHHTEPGSSQPLSNNGDVKIEVDSPAPLDTSIGDGHETVRSEVLDAPSFVVPTPVATEADESGRAQAGDVSVAVSPAPSPLPVIEQAGNSSPSGTKRPREDSNSMEVEQDEVDAKKQRVDQEAQ